MTGFHGTASRLKTCNQKWVSFACLCLFGSLGNRHLKRKKLSKKDKGPEIPSENLFPKLYLFAILPELELKITQSNKWQNSDLIFLRRHQQNIPGDVSKTTFKLTSSNCINLGFGKSTSCSVYISLNYFDANVERNAIENKVIASHCPCPKYISILWERGKK